MFNAIDTGTAYKIDLILRKDRPFSREEFSRRRVGNVTAELRGAIASPEDTILAKLEWARKSGDSEKQLRDVTGILEVTGDALERVYVQRWATVLGVLDLWRRVSEGVD